jgi:hypothetical protein
MPKTLEQILKEKGTTDADLAALAPLLTNAAFRTALEGELGTLETAKAKAETESEGWAKWHKETAQPTLEKYMKDAEDARAEAAAAKERIKLAQERGLLAGQPEEEVKPAAKDEPFDPKKHNLVTMDQVQTFAEAEAAAIASAQDLTSEYYELYGKPLSYVAENGSRGLTALRAEAKVVGKPLYDYTREKFKFSERRAELAAAQKKAEEDAIRKDERQKVIAETVNPMLRPPQGSISPFGRKPSEVADGVNPWDNESARKQARVEKALKTVLQTAV